MSADWTPQNVEDLCCYWLITYARAFKAASTYKRDQGMIKHYIVPSFGNRLISDLQARELEIWLQNLRIRSGLSEKTSNDTLGLLRKIYNDAVRWGFARDNPVIRVKKFRIYEQPYNYWEAHQVRQLISYIGRTSEPPRIWWPVALALYTGMRRGEIAALSWRWVDQRAGLIKVCGSYCRVLHANKGYTKSGKIRHVPISDPLSKLLGDIRRSAYTSQENVISGIHIDRYQPELAKLSRASGLPRIKFHDLRHTFASGYLASGGQIYDLKKILGHSTIQVTERYAHLSPHQLRGKTDHLAW